MSERTRKLQRSKTETPTLKPIRWEMTGICLALATITLAVFGQTARDDFVFYDDNEYVFDNPMVAQGLTFKGLIWAFKGAHAANWHPLTWLSHMLDVQLYGLRAGGHHLTSVLIHASTVIMLFLVLRQMTGALWRSAFVAAVFAIHPLRAESVAWVAERKDVLSGFFFVLTLGAYARYARQVFSWALYSLVLLLFALGLMCKPMLVTAPAVLLFVDYWPLRRDVPWRRLVVEKLPLFALSAAACVVTVIAQGRAVQSVEAYSMPLRFANALMSGAIYLRQMVFPAGLVVFYPFLQDGFPLGELALAGTLLAGISALAVWRRHREPWLLTGWLWYLVMLLPVIGLIQVGGQAHADRYTYLPQIGIYMAVTWTAAELGIKWHVNRAVFGAVMATLIALLMVLGWKQTSYWQNGETLWIHTIDCTTNNDMAYNCLGLAYNQKGDVDDAIACFQKAVEINPNCADAHNNLALVLLPRGKVDEAIAHCEKALSLEPYYKQTHINLGNALIRKRKVAAAISEYMKALDIDPDYAEAHNDLANALLDEGHVDEAIAQYHTALEINPSYADARYNLGIALARQTKNRRTEPQSK